MSTLSGSGGPSEGAAGDLGEVVEEGEEGAGVNLGAEQQVILLNCSMQTIWGPLKYCFPNNLFGLSLVFSFIALFELLV